MSQDRFASAVSAAIDSIPPRFQPYLENTQFIIDEGTAEGPLGLYEGGTAVAAGEWLPERITLFVRPHGIAAGNWEELVAEVRRTVLHEVGHHFGMSEAELPY